MAARLFHALIVAGSLLTATPVVVGAAAAAILLPASASNHIDGWVVIDLAHDDAVSSKDSG